MRIRIASKMAIVLGLMFVLIAATGVLGFHTVKSIGDAGYLIGTRMAPLSDATSEITVKLTEAHLTFEEIMSGDTAESIDDVRKLLDEAKFYIDAILHGATNETDTYLPTDAQEIRKRIEFLSENLNLFVGAIEQRYRMRSEDQGAGSLSDVRFDTLYEDLVKRLGVIGDRPENAGNAEIQKHIGEARYNLANGHVLLAEILSGDTGEEFQEALTNFTTAKQHVAALKVEADFDLKNIASDIDKLIESAKVRYTKDQMATTSGADADLAFDAAFRNLTTAANDAHRIVKQHIVSELEDLQSNEVGAIVQMALIAVLSVIVAIVAYRLFSIGIARRISALTVATAALASGDKSVEIPRWSGNDEITDLTNALTLIRDNAIGEMTPEQQAEAELKTRAARQETVSAFLNALRERSRNSFSGDGAEVQQT